MPFNEQIKKDVKKKAAFRCCRCHEIGIEIHHMIPQAEGGLDDIDNAAPLCPNCHTNFGANPEKRKELRQMRDWWYEVVSEKYHDGGEKWKTINELLVEFQKGNARQIGELQEKLDKIHLDMSQVKDEVQESVQHRVNEFITATSLADKVHANFQCKKCGTSVGLLIGSNRCPTCQQPIC